MDQVNSPGTGTAVKRQWTIAIVDDEAFCSMAIQAAFADEDDIKCVSYKSGETFLDAIKSGDTPDLAVVDVLMPEMSGFQVCAHLRREFTKIELPILLVSARLDDEMLMQGFAVGANDYMRKPISKTELSVRVRAMLDTGLLCQAPRSSSQDLDDDPKKQLMHADLVQHDKLSSLGVLLTGVAHELNNPAHYVSIATANAIHQLTSFREDFFQALDLDEADPDVAPFVNHFERLAEQLKIVEDGAGRISCTVSELKLFSHNDDNEWSYALPVDGLKATLRLLKGATENIEVIENFEANPLIKCMPARLKQVYMNLLVNASQALKGQVEPAPRIELRSHAEGDALIIEIEDNGPGVPEDVLPNLFEAFVTSKPRGEGTGLGLSISQNIIDKHGGQIEVSSTSDAGTTFSISLPLGENAGTQDT